jgi:uncharacterized protein
MPLFKEYMKMDCPVVVIPGHGNSGPAHWQSIWQSRNPLWQRMRVDNWDNAECDEWVSAIERRVTELGPETLIVAHSLGCLALVHWASRTSQRIRGALFVGVPDPASPVYPASTSIGFTPLPMQRLTFHSTLVTSTDDPYGSALYARACAQAWGSLYVEAGPRGHLNSDSGLGDWLEGYKLLEKLGRIE